MPKLLVFQHVPYEILGTLDPLLRNAGFRIRYVNFGRDPHARPSLDGYHALVVLGGPMNVDQAGAYPHLRTELELIEEALERRLSMLGICLGAQLIAKALGAKVRRNEVKEIGWYDVAPSQEAADDPVLSHLGPCEKIFQWHGDTFDVPAGAVRLATSSTCANQAFRYAENVYGFQFHLEVDERLIERWLHVPVHRRELESLRGVIDPQRIAERTPHYIGRSKQLSDAVFGSLVAMFGARKRYVALPSR